MTTLKDISRQLGLSVTQVSRALNDYPDVNEETRQRVKQAAKELNYAPNLSARRLVSGRSGMVGLVRHIFPGITEDLVFHNMVTQLSLEFAVRSRQFMLHVTPGDEDQIEAYAKLCSGGSLDGFVLIEPYLGDNRMDFLKNAGVPFVVHGRTGKKPDYPYYDIDNYGVGYNLTRHLIEKGHRSIAFINGVAERTYASERHRGFSDALAEARLPYYPNLVRNGHMTESFGLVSTITMMASAEPRPTAIIAGNILIAKGIYDAAHAMNLEIPKDISVVAHDDVMPGLRASAFYPALTVTRMPLGESWAPLAEFLCGAIDGKPLKDIQKVAHPKFVERVSVAKVGT